MLGKLIKHEWKSVYKICGIMLLAILAVTAICSIVLQMPWMKEFFAGTVVLDEVQNVILMFTMIIGFILYVFLLVGITYGILIYLGVHFYKTMYTDQGYLTNTLPVTPNQLLLSKILVSGIWYILIELAVVVSVIVFILSLIAGTGVLQEYTHAEIFGALGAEFELVLASKFGGILIHYLVFAVLTLLISPFAAMIILFAALTIGQLSRTHKGAMGILAYFGISIISMIISTIISMVYTLKISYTSVVNPTAAENVNMMGVYDASLIVMVVMAAVLYWAAHYILSKKLNMD